MDPGWLKIAQKLVENAEEAEMLVLKLTIVQIVLIGKSIAIQQRMEPGWNKIVLKHALVEKTAKLIIEVLFWLAHFIIWYWNNFDICNLGSIVQFEKLVI